MIKYGTSENKTATATASKTKRNAPSKTSHASLKLYQKNNKQKYSTTKTSENSTAILKLSPTK
jgi:hypothetical protein